MLGQIGHEDWKDKASDFGSVKMEMPILPKRKMTWALNLGVWKNEAWEQPVLQTDHQCSGLPVLKPS